ncbi:hypothetical protein [Serratia symbiotica]|uniref:Uncharacterized protein n=1 Tax=Serratia symbiotica TaxID=138074 RepID=A0A068Z3I2_9GAMM|nr:hypothetical protein [Serratia symbiotica]MBQ0956961.1 hypothetical protein [Serratia symbiotica]QLH61628.1 hypothetical protein SYMBAF_04045 [Serratia symbiotica]CDS55688.1 putative regulatory protein N [Serratia symbiotica]
MTVIIVKPAKDNSKNRRYRQRGQLIAKHRENAEFAKKLSKAWDKLTSPALEHKSSKEFQTQIIKAAEQQERRNHRIWYRDPNPLGNKIHAVQKSYQTSLI